MGSQVGRLLDVDQEKMVLPSAFQLVHKVNHVAYGQSDFRDKIDEPNFEKAADFLLALGLGKLKCDFGQSDHTSLGME